MTPINIVIISLLIIFIIWFLSYLFYNTNIVYDEMLKANELYTEKKNMIKHEDIPMNTSANFTLSVWLFIDDWSVNIGKEKNILHLNSEKLTKLSDDAYIVMTLDGFKNDINLKLKSYNLQQPSNNNYETFKIKNIPIQKWVCLTLSVDNKSVDVYIDGKLRNSYLMESTYNHDSASSKLNIYLGNISANDNGLGFNGLITRVRYIANSIDPEHSYNIYREGISKSLTSNLYNKYGLKVAFLEYDNEVGEFKI